LLADSNHGSFAVSDSYWWPELKPDTQARHFRPNDRFRLIDPEIATNSNKLNARFEETPAIVDILPSLATHLYLEIPGNIRDQLDGRSFID